MKTIVPIVSGNCVRMIRGAGFLETHEISKSPMRRSSPVGQMEAELTCSKYPIRVVCTYGAFFEVRIDRLTFDITIHNPIDSNIQQNSKWPFPPFDLTNA